MTAPTRPTPTDYIAIEERARQMRAEAFARGLSALWRWLRGRPAEGGVDDARTV